MSFYKYDNTDEVIIREEDGRRLSLYDARQRLESLEKALELAETGDIPDDVRFNELAQMFLFKPEERTNHGMVFEVEIGADSIPDRFVEGEPDINEKLEVEDSKIRDLYEQSEGVSLFMVHRL